MSTSSPPSSFLSLSYFLVYLQSSLFLPLSELLPCLPLVLPLQTPLSVTSLAASSSQSSFFLSLSVTSLSASSPPCSFLSLSYFLVYIQSSLFLPLSQLLPCLSPVPSLSSSLSVTSLPTSSPPSSFLSLSYFLACLQSSIFIPPLSQLLPCLPPVLPLPSSI